MVRIARLISLRRVLPDAVQAQPGSSLVQRDRRIVPSSVRECGNVIGLMRPHGPREIVMASRSARQLDREMTLA